MKDVAIKPRLYGKSSCELLVTLITIEPKFYRKMQELKRDTKIELHGFRHFRLTITEKNEKSLLPASFEKHRIRQNQKNAHLQNI